MNSNPLGAMRPDASLIASLEAARFHPLWDRYKRITPIAPRSSEEAMLWRWRDFEPLAERAAREVPIEDIERRAIIMANPAYGDQTVTTANLIAAFTILEPGDRAVPHRHTAAAIRFSTRAEGAVTIVNGRRCEMKEGDLVLTPPMCWHGHINESDHRTYWFDAANMPLIMNLDASFFEPGTRHESEFWQVDEGDERLFASPGLAPLDRTPGRQSSQYRFPGEATRRMLDAVPPAEDGRRMVRYVNPGTGGAVMSTLDCYAMRLVRGAMTRAERATFNTVCLVSNGEGRSNIGERRFEWSKHDVFTIPHWTWATHEAMSGNAELLLVTDRCVFEALDLLRIEVQ
ncbi:MAG: cupin domain-containing protein [Burkholderiales bacterium]